MKSVHAYNKSMYLKNPVMEAGVCHVEMGKENLHKLFL